MDAPWDLTPIRPKDWLHDRLRVDQPIPTFTEEVGNRGLAKKPTLLHPISQACTADQIYLPRYRQWVNEMGQPMLVHRKQWEWVYILQCLNEYGCFIDGLSGVGFGVGTEPITAVAANRGRDVLATDSDFDKAQADGWVDTDQHAENVAQLNGAGICDPELFEKRVKFQVVDMREVPSSIQGYDFTWSACALEHLGNLQAGFDFIWKSLDCIKPGGVAVHTTEYNVSSNEATVESGQTVLYRRRDLQELEKALREKGHEVKVTFGLGTTDDDRHIDEIPYTNCHLKVRSGDHVITSYGIVIRKGTAKP